MYMNIVDKASLLEFVKLNVKIHRNDSVYRFGDLVQHGGSRWEQDSFTIETQPKYAHTILAEYLHMHMDAGKEKIKKKQMKESHKQLAHLCQKHFKDRMSKASVAVHLRVGDENRAPGLARLKGCLENVYPPPEIVTVVTVLNYGANAKTGRYFASKHSINV